VGGRVENDSPGCERACGRTSEQEVVAAFDRGQRLDAQFTQRRALRREHRLRYLCRQRGPELLRAVPADRLGHHVVEGVVVGSVAVTSSQCKVARAAGTGPGRGRRTGRWRGRAAAARPARPRTRPAVPARRPRGRCRTPRSRRRVPAAAARCADGPHRRPWVQRSPPRPAPVTSTKSRPKRSNVDTGSPVRMNPTCGAREPGTPSSCGCPWAGRPLVFGEDHRIRLVPVLLEDEPSGPTRSRAPAAWLAGVPRAGPGGAGPERAVPPAPRCCSATPRRSIARTCRAAPRSPGHAVTRRASRRGCARPVPAVCLEPNAPVGGMTWRRRRSGTPARAANGSRYGQPTSHGQHVADGHRRSSTPTAARTSSRQRCGVNAASSPGWYWTCSIQRRSCCRSGSSAQRTPAPVR